jgi:hypothetical protein
MANPIQTWLEGVIEDAVKAAVDEAMANLRTELQTDIAAAETTLLTQISALPGLVGAQVKNVALDTQGIAQQVIGGISGQITSLPQQIIQGVIGGLNPFKGQRERNP